MKLFATVFLLFSGSLVQAKDLSDTLLIRKHLISLTKTPGFRNHQNLKTLNQAAEFITSEFKKYSKQVTTQEYEAEKQTYQNIICSFGPENAPRIIVGAHYD